MSGHTYDARDNAGTWLHNDDGTSCPTYWAPTPRTIYEGAFWWCSEHQQHVHIDGDTLQPVPGAALIGWRRAIRKWPEHLAELTAQRDQARDWVAHLEAENARLKVVVDAAGRLGEIPLDRHAAIGVATRALNDALAALDANGDNR